ncbi:hypothetical protein K2X05_06770, partial [bacterium]|nr:hypothetical protein [bacterium]
MVNIIFLLINVCFSEYVPLPPNYKCPPPKTRISPSIDYKVKFDSKTKLFNYDYSLSNRGGLLPITSLYFYVSESPTNIRAPVLKNIDSLEQWEIVPYSDRRIGWFTAGDSLSNGRKIEGFKVSSYHKPGIIKYTTAGYIEESPHIDA